MRAIYFLVFAAAWRLNLAWSCSNANWWSSFDKKGYSTCGSDYKYINGFYRNNPGGSSDPIYRLEEAKCCYEPSTYWSDPTDCQVPDWWTSFDRQGWSTCPSGHFLQGLYRNSCDKLYCIEYGKCCKPASHPYWWGHCYNQNVWSSFDKKGWSKCKDGYFIAGLYRTSGNNLYNLEEFKCCKMVAQPPTLVSLSDVKTRVMDVTLPNLALLAHYLGYGWCAGCRAQWVGEDFRRNGDSWEAAKIGTCNGYKAGHRLKLHYGDFKFGIKSIRYGSAVVQSMTPQVYLSGTVTNNDPHDTKTTIEREVRSVRTVTHTTTSSWKHSHELGVEISYTPPATGGVGAKASYKFSYEKTTTTTDSTSNQQWNIIKIKSEKTLKPHTKAKWQILVTKQRVTVPYTATVIAKFSAQTDGFLRWGGGYNGGSTNYHYQYRGSDSRPTFKYRFGSGSIPFYKALKEQSDRNTRPWQWHDVKQKYSSAQRVINTLVDEKYYEFTLSGQFEDVLGTHADIQWHSLTSKRSVPLQDTAPNPKDPPRVFPKPPEVEIFKNRNKEKPAVPNQRASGI